MIIVISKLQSRTKFVLVLMAACLIMLQAGAISLRSFWEDETVTAVLGPMDYGSIVKARAADNHPPLYWLSAALWGRVFGYREWGLKSYSLLWLVIVLWLVYKLTNLLYDNRAAWMATAIMVFSPFVLTYGHNARYYSMSAALALLLAWMAKRYQDRGQWVNMAFYTIAGVALMYTVYMGATILIAFNLWYLAVAIRNRIQVRKVVIWLFAQTIILLAYLPWLGILIAAAGRNLNQTFVVGNLVEELLIRYGYLGFAYLSGEFISPLNPLVWLIGILFIVVSILAAGRTFRKSWLPFIVLALCLTLSVIVNIISVYPQSAWQNLSNRTFFVFPFFVVWLAGNLADLRPKFAYLSLGIIFLVFVVGIFNYFTNAQMVKPLLAVPWREMMQKIQEQKTPDAVVLCSGGDVACQYYLKRYDLDGTENWNREYILNQHPDDLWWIQINLGAPNRNSNQPVEFVESLAQIYQKVSVTNYAPQDASIRSIKSDYFHQVDYEYRVSLYHFFVPVQP